MGYQPSLQAIADLLQVTPIACCLSMLNRREMFLLKDTFKLHLAFSKVDKRLKLCYTYLCKRLQISIMCKRLQSFQNESVIGRKLCNDTG
jgi:hypothetical protein